MEGFNDFLSLLFLKFPFPYLKQKQKLDNILGGISGLPSLILI